LKLLFTINVDWFFISHFLPVAIAAKDAGYDVSIVTCNTGRRKEIEDCGLKFIELPFRRSGTNFWHETKCILTLAKIFRREKPDIIHNITLKACMLSSIAAKISGQKNVENAITGFGYNFTDNRKHLKQQIINHLFKFSFRSKKFHFIFENPDDLQQFASLNITQKDNIHLIKGAGVDLNQFSYAPEIEKPKVRFLLPARMLRDKGIVEYINAAKKLKEEYADKAEFLLAGECDTINLAGIAEEELRKMLDFPYIQWLGFRKDMYETLKNSDVIVLPSYREGLPKALIEACAVGRPIITTDTTGCRECVIDGHNGFLVPVKDTEILLQKMKILIDNGKKRTEMGKNSRKFAEKEFSITQVIEKHLIIYRSLLKNENPDNRN